ncbi:HD-domain/PDEase-like protein [Metschnikowia bicuspidata var. bicuspidata NRRL YB-4993]|uniref:Phosphodiesterase n=1 Tax=Metschnikowia bicuspidata var. bicuspidata NRRL YB-4993 TaxID=869754 RepID=A0A1A0H9J4_9ASCO|nr:HD-domain/PDEase-like protein [Metschnikowia bicuspidata var. bicuspidata NRRL YB-4993]OBA20686.1 HD-domain/PDEase-like protein [Metschnikowia bicuspidata var. bicuspidata NRRL YB-4993]
MAEVFYVSPEHTYHAPHVIRASKTRHLTALAPLLKTFFKRANDEHDVNNVTVVVLHVAAPFSASPQSLTFSELDSLPFVDRALLLRYFFSHMNLIVVSTDDMRREAAVSELNKAITKIEGLLKNRISRVATWTGTGTNINDVYAAKASGEQVQISEIVATMSFLVHHHANMSCATQQHVEALKNVVLRSIDFSLLLQSHSETRRRQLCHIVGHWSFPAHELSYDDLVYCVYLMLAYALGHVHGHVSHSASTFPHLDFPGLEIPTPNELLAMVFMVRDTYKSGNSFHNFRHAVDVLQACFHFLIRLKCLPEFEQLELDPRALGSEFQLPETKTYASPELVARPASVSESAVKAASGNAPVPLLNSLQSLGLMIAALGHDVGHPGVTNAYMIKHASPTSQLFGDRSVLELFHASVFVNKILNINWPSLLAAESSPQPNESLALKDLIINSILATDMAEHFEYVSKLKMLELSSAEQTSDKVKLICSLLIKCADISNVTRPLRVSSQWALVLSHEFSEVEVLERAVQNDPTKVADAVYPQLPYSLDDILETYPGIHKGQIFFIQTFAEGLFRSIAEHFPGLQYTSEIMEENKQFWLDRAEEIRAEGSSA